MATTAALAAGNACAAIAGRRQQQQQQRPVGRRQPGRRLLPVRAEAGEGKSLLSTLFPFSGSKSRKQAGVAVANGKRPLTASEVRFPHACLVPCSTPQSPSAFTSTDAVAPVLLSLPVQAARAYYDAYNAKDIERVMELIAPDCVCERRRCGGGADWARRSAPARPSCAWLAGAAGRQRRPAVRPSPRLTCLGCRLPLAIPGADEDLVHQDAFVGREAIAAYFAEIERLVPK